MPFLDTALRQQLGLVTSCPSEEAIAAAAAARGLHFCPHTLTLTPASTLEGRSYQQVKTSRARRKTAVQAIEQALAIDA